MDTVLVILKFNRMLWELSKIPSCLFCLPRTEPRLIVDTGMREKKRPKRWSLSPAADGCSAAARRSLVGAFPQRRRRPLPYPGRIARSSGGERLWQSGCSRWWRHLHQMHLGPAMEPRLLPKCASPNHLSPPSKVSLRSSRPLFARSRPPSLHSRIEPPPPARTDRACVQQNRQHTSTRYGCWIYA